MKTKLVFGMYVRLCVYTVLCSEKLELMIILKIAVFCCLAVGQIILYVSEGNSVVLKLLYILLGLKIYH